MKPPICEYCGKRFSTAGAEAGLVRFALTEEDKLFNKRFEEPGFVGHPRGLAWFCEDHYKQAKSLKSKTLSEAMKIIAQGNKEAWWKPLFK